MTFKEKKEACVKYFDELANLLNGSYEVVSSCNNEHFRSRYLIKNGTVDELTYESKPMFSFRISDHWNWYSSTKKCTDHDYIQCFTTDMPRVKKRETENGASKPVFGVCVAFFDEDKKYHVIFGEKFDRRTKKWSWVNTSPIDIANSIKGGVL